MNLIFHADDFGISPEQSRRILDRSGACGGSGALNSLSVLVNSPSFPACAALLDAHLDHIHVGLHVNVVEGTCCAEPGAVGLLVDEAGMFKLGFATLLLSARGNARSAYRAQLQTEIGAQIDVFLSRFPQMREHMRVDSHQHFHLIPVVFEALVGALQERGCTLEYLRIPAEPVTPFLRTPSVWFKIPPINWVKHWLLDYLWRLDKRIWRTSPLPPYQDVSAVFCGIDFSGHMTEDRIRRVLPAFVRYAGAHDMDLEFLFHPGGYPDAACALNPALDGFVAFYTSPFREAEGQALEALGADPGQPGYREGEHGA